MDILKNKAEKAKSMIDSNSLYFAHPVNYYMESKFNTKGKTEKKLITILRKNFPLYSVYNPNQEYNQENYQLWKRETGSGMKYYFDVILPLMNCGVALPFEDGMFGAGVFGELEFLNSKLKPIYEINDNGIILPIKKLDYSRKLSIEETQRRVYNK